MIDYKYPTIASGATPIGSAGRAPDEESLWGEWGRKFRVHELDIYSHWESGFKNPKILESQRIEIKNWINQSFQEVEELKSKIQEVEDWSIWRLKIWSFGDSTRVCNLNWVSGAADMGMPIGYP
jgi:hypothetical protein